MANETLRLAVVDDHFIYRRGLVDILKEWPRGQVALQAANGWEYERACANIPRIHIALVDLYMPVRDGFQTTSWISRNQERTLVLGITEKPTAAEVLRMLRTGVHGVVCKSVCDERLLRALDQLDRQGFHYNEWVDKGLRRQVEDERPSTNAILAAITKREKQFLLLYAEPPFPSLAEVATRMGLTLNGVESLRKLVAERINCRKREQMIQFVMENGLG